MNNTDVKGLEEAQKILRANTTPRARTLDEYEREVDGTRFDGRRPWTDDCPIYDKRPCIVYHAVESSINSKKDLLLGEGRFPAITSRPDEDEDDSEDGLDEAASQEFDKFINSSMVREARLKALFREDYSQAQGCGTSVAVGSVRRGRLCAETLPAKFATPTYENGDVVSVEILYPYIRTERVDDGWKATCYLYRRVLDQVNDTTFKPAVARLDAVPPSWQIEVQAPHGFGFCPVIWYKHDAPQQNIATFDGNPVHKNLLNELEQMDLALSQRQHGALGALPQIVEIGVEPGYSPTAQTSGEMSPVGTTMHGGSPNPQTNPIRGEYRTRPSVGRGARKKGPNHVWQYESPDTKVAAINTPGDALTAIDDNIKDLRNKICETLAWVPLDPDSIKFAATVSGKALEILRERELNRVCQDREVFGEDVILGVVNMLLRIALIKAPELKTPRLKKVLPILKKFVGTDGKWQAPMLTLRWPSFFVPSPEDEKFVVDMAIEAHDKGKITLRTCVQSISRIFGITNVDEYCEALEKEATEKRQQALEDNAATLAKFHDDAGTGPSAGGSGKSKANPPPGAGGAGSATGNPPKAKAADT